MRDPGVGMPVDLRPGNRLVPIDGIPLGFLMPDVAGFEAGLLGSIIFDSI